jgi:outer membrane receptor for ferrienterochelin and colicin
MSQTSRLLWATLPFTFAALGIAQPALAQTSASPADAGQQAPTQADASSEADDSEIVVTGSYARSLAAATETKRLAAFGVDSINSTDIGKFPTQNVAEALQLVTGVAITRPRGEGLYVSVRSSRAPCSTAAASRSTT